jgi:Lrp/AsnC family leucine-responsive transcriptional regulator
MARFVLDFRGIFEKITGMEEFAIDDVDRRILAVLQKNARTSNADIARMVGKAPSAVLQRIRKLEKSGVIQGYEAKIDPRAVGLGLTAFIMVLADEQVGSTRGGEELAELPGVQAVHYCAGRDAYMLKVRVADTEGLARMIAGIGELRIARDTNSTIVLRTIKETLALPLDDRRQGAGQA